MRMYTMITALLIACGSGGNDDDNAYMDTGYDTVVECETTAHKLGYVDGCEAGSANGRSCAYGERDRIVAIRSRNEYTQAYVEGFVDCFDSAVIIEQLCN
jgi:hypothetical protein